MAARRDHPGAPVSVPHVADRGVGVGRACSSTSLSSHRRRDLAVQERASVRWGRAGPLFDCLKAWRRKRTHADSA